MMSEALTSELFAFASVVLIDLVLAGDNAIVVALAASSLPRELQRRAVAYGVGVAVVTRILFALVAIELLSVIGLLLAGGLLLLWVAWKMWRELHHSGQESSDASGTRPVTARKSFAAAIWQITIADVSMSLDNVLGVAGAAREHIGALVFGLVLSVGLMGAAAAYIAPFMNRHRWLQYVGLLVVTYVALSMIYEGGLDVWREAPQLGIL
jgi:YjbE family integral membrane protein